MDVSGLTKSQRFVNHGQEMKTPYWLSWIVLPLLFIKIQRPFTLNQHRAL